MRYISHRDVGFTLVEVLVVAPIVILVLSAIVAIIINIAGASMISTAQLQLQHEVQTVLDEIENDVKLSVETGVDTPGVMALKVIATDKNPLNRDRNLIDKTNCRVADSAIESSSALIYSLKYTTHGNALKRQATFSECKNSTTPWRRHLETEVLIRDAHEVMLTAKKLSNAMLGITLRVKRMVAGQEIHYTGTLRVKSINIAP